MRLEQAVNAGLRHEVALFIGKRHRQLSRAELLAFQRHIEYLFLHLVGDPVPYTLGACPTSPHPAMR